MSSKRYDAKCIVCKKEFIAKKKGTRFCSNVCRAQYSRDNRLKLIQSQGNVIRSQDQLVRSVPVGAIKDKVPVEDYLIKRVELYQIEGYNWIRMEEIVNFSLTLFGTPGTIPNEFHLVGYDFKRMDEKRYSFKKKNVRRDQAQNE